jgi:tetratricopeptide (TPR) repeat protein
MFLKNSILVKALCVCLLAGAFSLFIPAAETPSGAGSTVFTLITTDAGGKELRKGAGFFIRGGMPDGSKRLFLVTARQNLEGARGAKIVDNQGKEIPVIFVFARNDVADLVVLWLDKVEEFKALEVADRLPTVGARMRIVTRGPDNEIVVKEGVSEGVKKAPRALEFLQIAGVDGDIPAGCPVIDAEGRVAGVTTVQLKQGRPLVLAQFALRLLGLEPGDRLTVAQVFGSMTPGLAELRARGTGALVNNQYATARECFDSVVMRDQVNVDAWMLKGYAALQMKELSVALKATQQAVTLAPEDPEVQNQLGVIYRQSGQAGKALEHYRQAIRLNDAYAPAHFNLANLYRSQNKLEEAIAEYRKATEIDPEYSEAHYNLGLCFAMKQRYADAVPHFQRAVELTPNDAEAHYSLGLAHLFNGNKSAAQKELAALEKMDAKLARQLEGMIRQR